mmetsp:Transcript_34360/g.73172  ORF Transcript_34360/g.73172 Transcript_34360/m.73172 type:complete len:229 (+) Transcript_34360:858-1544(+)
MVKLLEHGKLFAHLLMRHVHLVRMGLADHLANANLLPGARELRAVRRLVHLPKAALSEFLAEVVDILAPLLVLLQELLTPILVPLLPAHRPRARLNANLAAGQHEGEQPEKQSLEFLEAHSAIAALVLLEHAQDLFVLWRNDLELAKELVERRPELAVTEVTATSQLRTIEGPLRIAAELVLALHQHRGVLPTFLRHAQPRLIGRNLSSLCSRIRPLHRIANLPWLLL